MNRYERIREAEEKLPQAHQFFKTLPMNEGSGVLSLFFLVRFLAGKPGDRHGNTLGAQDPELCVCRKIQGDGKNLFGFVRQERKVYRSNP